MPGNILKHQAVILAACLLLPGLGSAADAALRLPDGRPDFSGLWLGGGGIRGIKLGDEMIMTPWAREIYDYRTDPDGNAANEDPNLMCLPSGVPRMSPYPWRIVQTPMNPDESHIFILFEGNIHSYRQIFMDGRAHTENPDPTWYGESIGWYEGDTLVVDTIGYNDKTWFSFQGHPHSEALHTVERFTRVDASTLSWEITIEDPVAYEKPFTVQTEAKILAGELMEYICTENNTNIGNMRGPARNPGN